MNDIAIKPIVIIPPADTVRIVPEKFDPLPSFTIYAGFTIPGVPEVPAIPERPQQSGPNLPDYVPGKPAVPAVPAVAPQFIASAQKYFVITQEEWDAWGTGTDDDAYILSLALKRWPELVPV